MSPKNLGSTLSLPRVAVAVKADAIETDVIVDKERLVHVLDVEVVEVGGVLGKTRSTTGRTGRR